MQDSKRILVVEDESIVAFDIERGLERQGFKVTAVVNSGEQAVEQASLYSPDLVLMDIGLKGSIDGIAAASQVQERFRIPVVFLTAHSDQLTLTKAMGTSPYGFVVKPFDDTEIRAAIEIALCRFDAETKPYSHKPQIENTWSIPSTADSSKTKATSALFSASESLTPFQILQRIPSFEKIPAVDLETLANAAEIIEASPGQLLTYEGEELSAGFIVISGRISMFKTSLNSKELIVELLSAGDLFSLICTLQHNSSQLTARAQTHSEILRVPSRNFLELLDAHPGLYRELIVLMSDRLQASHDFARGLAHDRVEVRIANALCALVPRFAQSELTPHTISMTRQEIADLTGTTPETAIRTTKAMERVGLLELLRPGTIRIMDLAGLEAIAKSN